MNQPLDKDIQFLEHFGVKGQRWGVRKSSSGVHPKTDRDAAKDAKEFARAKLYYGTGAGTRRKLIKATVESKSKQNPDYAKAFDHHLAKQDLGQHASKAQSERKRTDRKDTTKKAAGLAARKFTGEMGTKAAFTAVILGGAAFAASPRGQAMMNKSYKSATNFVNSKKASKTSDYLANYFMKNS